MKLMVRYESCRQYIELDTEQMDKLWLSLSLESVESITEQEKEEMLQKAFDEEFNHDDYNSWHQSDRNTVQMSLLTKNSEDPDADDALAVKAKGNQGYYSDEDEIRKFEDEEQFKDDCRWVRDVLKSKPHWASAFIAVRMKGSTVRDYANSIDADETAVSHWLERAEKKLRKFYENRQT